MATFETRYSTAFNYNKAVDDTGAVTVINRLNQKNNQTFPLMHAADISIGDDESIDNRLNKKLEALDAILREIYGDVPSTLENYGTGMASLAALAAVLNNSTTTVDSRVSDSVAAEAALRTAADNTLQGNIDAEASTRATDDEALQDNIDAEESARQTADETLQGNINTEAQTRETNDGVLQDNIDAEETARINGDSALTTALGEETTARTNADSGLSDRLDAIEADYLQAAALNPYITEANADLKYQAIESAQDPYVITSAMAIAIEAAIQNVLEDYDMTLKAPVVTAALDGTDTTKINLDQLTFRGTGIAMLEEQVDSTWTPLADTSTVIGENPISFITEHNGTYRVHVKREYRNQIAHGYSASIVVDSFEPEPDPEEDPDA